jgi:sulfatase modifying factor 1
MNTAGLCRAICTAVVTITVTSVATAVNVDTVAVGNPGNAPDTRYASPGYGSVGYTFQIGKFEITAGQYTEFLNAVADTDSYELYSIYMGDPFSYYKGCNIQRSGSSGSYAYSVAPDWANRPVNWVSWGDAARFANWLYNGQPTGPQNLSTTEDGSYYLNGATTDAQLLAVTRKANATWVIPSEDEWYKAAYHKNDGVTGNYWDYPTETNSVPSNDLINPDPGNNANFYQSGYTIGGYDRTEVGEFENSESPYETFDQGGNVWEWNEAVIGPYRGVRGGAFSGVEDLLSASRRDRAVPSLEYYGFGFRVALVPEPAALVMLVLGSALTLRRKRG